MGSFGLAASVVLPLIVYMGVGGLIRKLSLFSEENFRAVNGLIFRVFIPLTLFFNVYRAEFQDAFNIRVFLYTVAAVLIGFCAVWVIVSRRIPDGRDAATVIQGTFRSNFVLFGTTVAMSLCEASGVALVSALAAVVVPLFNMLAVILFEMKRGGTVKPWEILVNIFKNPLVDAGILGCICSAFHVPIPEFLAEPLATLGDIATPLALVSLGGMLSFASMVSHRKYLVWTTAGRLVILPALALGGAVLLGMRGEELVAVFAVFASPTAVASAPMAQSMGGNGVLAGEIVVTTTVCSMATIFLFVCVLSGAGLL